MKKILLFDFDGVIVDSFDVAYSLAQKLDGPMNIEKYRDKFMGNIYDSIADFTPEEDMAKYDKQWFDEYTPMLMKLPVFSDMKEVLELLSRTYTLVILSSTISSPIKEFLTIQNIGHHFDYVYGSDVHYSKVKKIDMVFKKYKVTAKNCLFITDTVGDLKEARQKNIASLAVSWGFHPKERFLEYNPYAIIDKPSEMTPKVAIYFNG